MQMSPMKRYLWLKGISIPEAAKIMEIRPQTLYAINNGSQKNPRSTTIKKIKKIIPDDVFKAHMKKIYEVE